MDLQKILNNAVAAQRAQEMLTSPQLTMGELILKLSAMPLALPVVFDDPAYKPTGLGSWRGSYRELAIQYEYGGNQCYEQPGPDCTKDEFGDHDYKCKCGGTKAHDTTLPDNPTVKDLLDMLQFAQGKFFVGYKGGDFTMGKTTPVWVANDGNSSGFKTGEKGYESQAIVDVTQEPERVVLNTATMN